MQAWLQQMLSDAVASGSLLVYVFAFLGGVAASFTPCTYPILPLTVGYIGNAAGESRSKGFFISLALVLGMAAVYSIVGIIFSAIGMQFGAIWANGWAVFAIAWFFIIMSLFLLDVFTFPTPRFLQKLQGQRNDKKGFLGAFLVGAVSGLVIGPCTGPILAVVLMAVSTTLESSEGIAYVYQIITGGMKLFLFGLGQGTLILLCGSFAGLLSHLPKSGQWMVTIKKGFALLILAGASLILVFVGQATNFPSLTGLLAQLETNSSGSEFDNPNSRTTNTDKSKERGIEKKRSFGGDEFLE